MAFCLVAALVAACSAETVKMASQPWVRSYVATNAASGGGVDTNAVLGLIEAATNAITPKSIGAQTELPRDDIDDLYDISVRDAKNAHWAQCAEQASEDGQGNDIRSTYARKSDLDGLSGTVFAWQTYWDGDDVRVTVTNYYGSKDIPSLYLEQKMPADESNDAPWFKIVWDERTRWIAFMPGYEALCDFVNNHLADRAWGVYDSSTGEYSPDGLLQLSQDQIMISPGMSYQKTVTAGGNAYWILRANDPTTVSGVTSNGFFRIEDFDGNPLIEIVKGNKRIVGANIASIDRAGDDGFTLTFNVNSDAHPDVYFADRLSAGEWHRIESRGAGAWLDWHWEVEWSGAPGAWIASITWKSGISVLPFTPPPPSTGFFRATYEAGGNTYIRNNVATSIDKVVVGGIEYTVTVETVNGKKLLVLQ